ncbi:nucleotidyltransferase domain-containing protein [Candidatus Micrarchaeota archaeon]|nr:nucleotidyltransferase domain-containing protein [Candidatus Micrarchaeota archaeon]
MFRSWHRFKGWSVLEYFLQHPTSAIHVNALARHLKISPLTANTYLTEYFKEEMLEREAKANAIFYRLTENPMVNALKRTYALATLHENDFVKSIISENPQATSIVLYGTRASGTYDEKSDYDVLVFSKNPTFPKRAASRLDAPVSLRIVTVGQWRMMNPSFKESVRKNHVVLFGTGLVMG